MAGVINELQAVVEHPEDHWTKVVTEFKLANETLRREKDRLISLVRKFGCGLLFVIQLCSWPAPWHRLPWQKPLKLLAEV